jgi:sugar phosphate isomerase/epimerase
MYYTGFADEASPDIDVQIKATKALGWRHIEARGLYGTNLAGLTEAQFEELCGKLAAADVAINSYGSGVANWASPITEPPDKSYEEMRRAIPRMRRLAIPMIRIMSYEVPADLRPRHEEFFPEVVKRMKTLVAMAADAGILCVHENCGGWGGLSWEHTLRLLEAVDSLALKLVWDTGNPVFHADVRGQPPYRNQDAWEFYRHVRDHIVYVHIKDGYVGADGKAVYTFAGEGHGHVRETVRDLLSRGYDGGISMEPHMASVFHEGEGTRSKAEQCYDNYVEYGRRFMALVDEVRRGLAR